MATSTTAATSAANPAAPIAAKRMVMVWTVTLLAVFLVLILLGLSMRLNQAGAIDVDDNLFYAIMTLHGLGMAGTLFMGGVVAVWYHAWKYVPMSLGVQKLIYVLVVAGTVGLVIATLIGKHASGWYMLYPLPFMKTWPAWSTLVAIISLIVLGSAWLLAQLDLLWAFAKRYGAGRLLAWQYFTNDHPEGEELPSFVLISTVSLFAGAVTTIVGAVVFLLYLAKWFEPSLEFDNLLMKNMVFLFGHTIVNITMYLGVAIIYERFPLYSGRRWYVNRVVAIAWNATLCFILLAFLHHLYMDFAQPDSLQVLGLVASYLSAVPATVVTMFGAGLQVYKNDIKWEVAPLAYYLGMMGWAIGGLAAVLDTTIAINFYFHNTLWVPGHFHTYFLVGYVLMFLGAFHEIVAAKAQKYARIGLLTFVVGGYGVVSMFYLAGVAGVPRRYASYTGIPVESVASAGQALAGYASWFVGLVIIGLLIYSLSIVSEWKRSWSEA